MKKLIALVFMLSAPAWAEDEPRMERHYVGIWCQGDGFSTDEKVRDENGVIAGYVDCFIERGETRYAVEFNFSARWAEALGQALWYGLETSAKPAVALIHKDGTSPAAFSRHYDNLSSVVHHNGLGVTIICIGADGSEKPCILKERGSS